MIIIHIFVPERKDLFCNIQVPKKTFVQLLVFPALNHQFLKSLKTYNFEKVVLFRICRVLI